MRHDLHTSANSVKITGCIFDSQSGNCIDLIFNRSSGHLFVRGKIGIQPSKSELPSIAMNKANQTTKIPRIQPGKKNESRIGHILEKDKLTNRDMSKLSRLMAQEDYARKADSLKSLEIKDKVKVTVEKELT